MAMCLPLILRLLVQIMYELRAQMERWYCYRVVRMHERVIEQATTRNSWGHTNSTDEDCQNSVLMKAIVLYLHKVVQLNMKEADVNLTSTEDKTSSLGHNYYYDDMMDDDEEDDHSRTVAEHFPSTILSSDHDPINGSPLANTASSNRLKSG